MELSILRSLEVDHLDKIAAMVWYAACLSLGVAHRDPKFSRSYPFEVHQKPGHRLRLLSLRNIHAAWHRSLLTLVVLVVLVLVQYFMPDMWKHTMARGFRVGFVCQKRILCGSNPKRIRNAKRRASCARVCVANFDWLTLSIVCLAHEYDVIWHHQKSFFLFRPRDLFAFVTRNIHPTSNHHQRQSILTRSVCPLNISTILPWLYRIVVNDGSCLCCAVLYTYACLYIRLPLKRNSRNHLV